MADSVVSPEGYRLESGPDGPPITLATDAGLFYGLQTLLQLANPSSLEAMGGYLPLSKVYSCNPVPVELSEREAERLCAFRPTFGLRYIFSDSHYEYMIYPRFGSC